MIILVLNCGSSSLKYQLLDMKGDDVYDLLAKGLVERIGMETGCLKHQATGKESLVKEMPIEDHTVGIKAVIDALLDKEYGVLSSLDDIEAVGHRVVHGAEEFVCSQLITDIILLTYWASGLSVQFFLLFRRSVCSILHSTRACLLTHICMLFRMSIMKNTASAATDSMEQATSMCLPRVLSSLVWI